MPEQDYKVGCKNVINTEIQKDRWTEVSEQELWKLLTDTGPQDVAHSSSLNEVKSMRGDPPSGQYGGTSYTNISY